MIGSKAQLERVVPLLRAASEQTGGRYTDAIVRVKEMVSLLSEEVEAAHLNELKDRMPTLSEGERKNLAGFVKFGLHTVKATLLKEIEVIETERQPMTDSSLREWLIKTKERYEKWLSML